MNANKGLTRVDVIIAVACIALILTQAGVINAGGRERSKREVCLANLRMLTAAWKTYADDNAGKLVNGGQSWSNTPPPKEPYWCTPLPPVPATDEVGSGWPTTRFDWDTSADTPRYPYAERVSLLKRGALYKYCQDVTVFRCPEADKLQHRSYVMPCSMNALCNGCGSAGLGPVVKSLGQIAKPNERIAFLEEKIITPDAFQFGYSPSAPTWFDRPDITHDNGANFGFADGHAAFRKWVSQKMIDWIKRGGGYPVPTYSDCKEDLAWMHNAIWGVAVTAP
jgi:prepilin-type processing-associated H-X9-DG protein